MSGKYSAISKHRFYVTLKFTWILSGALAVMGFFINHNIKHFPIFSSWDFTPINIALTVISVIALILDIQNETIETIILNSNKQKELLEKHYETSIEQLIIASRNGAFLKVNGIDTLYYLADNIDDYTEVLNIRIRSHLSNNIALSAAIDSWRHTVFDAIKRNKPIKFTEIIAGKNIKMLEEAGGLVHEFKNTKMSNRGQSKCSYEYYELIDEVEKLRIRNFMLFKRKPKEKNDQATWELYWGWNEESALGEAKRFRTYLTTDPEMTKDYKDRFDSLVYDIQVRSLASKSSANTLISLLLKHLIPFRKHVD
jgi:hypothetical protein